MRTANHEFSSQLSATKMVLEGNIIPRLNDGASRPLNARAFGARGDGITDDAAALTAWLNAGNNLYLDSGTYIVESQILSTIKRRDVAISAHPAAKIRVSNDFNDTLSVIRIENTNRLTVSGVTIEQNASRATRSFLPTIGTVRTMSSIRLENCHAVTIRECLFLDVAKVALRAEHCNGLLIVNCRVLDTWGYGIGVFYSDSVIIDGNYIVGAERPFPNDLLHDNESGIGVLVAWGDHVKIVNNFINNMRNTGSKTEGCNFVLYNNNVVMHSGKDGIKVQASPDALIKQVHHATITNNTVRYLKPIFYDGTSLIQLWDVQDFLCSKNTIQGGQKGVTSTGYECGIKVFASMANGVRFGSVSSNIIDSVGHSGIYVLNAANIKIDSNIVTNYALDDKDVHGIWLSEVNNTELTRNLVKQTARTTSGKSNGLYAQICFNITVKKNSFFNTRSAGIKARLSSGEYSTFSNNIIRNSGQRSININGVPGANLIWLAVDSNAIESVGDVQTDILIESENFKVNRLSMAENRFMTQKQAQ